MLDSGCLKNANEDQNSLSEQLLQGCIFYLSIHHKMQQIPEKLKWDSKKVEDLYEIYLLKKLSTMAGLEPAIPRSEVWCLIH